MKNLLILLFSILPFIASCQTQPNKLVRISPHEWDTFLNKFPTKSIHFLDSLRYYQHLKDTVSIDVVDKFFWSDSIPSKAKRIDGKKINKVKVASSLYKGTEFLFPCCGNASKEAYKILNEKDIECSGYTKLFPLAKIYLSNGNIMILYSYVSGWDVFYRVTVEVINKNYEKTGHWGFLYGADWKHCDDTIYEMGENPTPYTYPFNISENGFEVSDELIESEYNEAILKTIWKVEITEKGQFEIVHEKKIYEDKVELWSKKGYYIKDKDGFSNLREQPNNKSKIVAKLPNGTALEILDSSKEWWEVKCLIDKKGFIHKSRIIEGGQ